MNYPTQFPRKRYKKNNTIFCLLKAPIAEYGLIALCNLFYHKTCRMCQLCNWFLVCSPMVVCQGNNFFTTKDPNSPVQLTNHNWQFMHEDARFYYRHVCLLWSLCPNNSNVIQRWDLNLNAHSKGLEKPCFICLATRSWHLQDGHPNSCKHAADMLHMTIVVCETARSGNFVGHGNFYQGLSVQV